MQTDYLFDKCGSLIQQALIDTNVTEVMLNPDLNLWVHHKAQGHQQIGTLQKQAALTFAHAVAHYAEKYLNAKTPYLDTTLPFSGERINITVPPISEQVSFNIRKKNPLVLSLDDYVEKGIVTDVQAKVLGQAIAARKNILISGSPAAGKTTLANALLDDIAKTAPPGQRILLLEQVPELQCNVANVKRLLVSEHVSMRTLLWLCMRSSPERIVIGEVRDGAALDMLKAWNTGCPGGIATIHSNSAKAAVQRVLDLSCEVSTNPPFALCAEALDVIVQISNDSTHPARRRVTDIIELKGFDAKTKQFTFQPLIKEQTP